MVSQEKDNNNKCFVHTYFTSPWGVLIRVTLGLASPFDFKIWKSKFEYFGDSVADVKVVEVVAENNLLDDSGKSNDCGVLENSVASRNELPNRNVFITINIRANCNLKLQYMIQASYEIETPTK